MPDAIDATGRTTGRAVFRGTARFRAEGEEYGTQAWLLRADDEKGAMTTLDRLSDEDIHADPRIDFTRHLEVEEEPIDLG